MPELNTYIPKEEIKRGLELAKGSMFYDVPLESLSRDELLACAALGWEAHNNSLKQHIKDMDFLRSIE